MSRESQEAWARALFALNKFDLAAARRSFEDDSTAYTPAISLTIPRPMLFIASARR